eukprot:GHVU01141674.1.p2 GENE.GHVU01141674.1~~GHVU01141674.1.p2  ORF type:complete len:109 (-),score=20.21 GHVU01141674.1:13-339(-)
MTCINQYFIELHINVFVFFPTFLRPSIHSCHCFRIYVNSPSVPAASAGAAAPHVPLSGGEDREERLAAPRLGGPITAATAAAAQPPPPTAPPTTTTTPRASPRRRSRS